MSRGIVEAQTLRSEQFEFEGRTSDPADAQPGEYWIRTGQTSTNPDVIAQLRRQDNSGVTTCPIFAASEESNLGTDVTRGPSVVLDDGSVGFVAMTTGSGAVGSPRAVNSAGTQYVSHNALELNSIPDEGVFHWFDFSSDTPLQNLVSGNADLTGSYAGTTETINGNQAGEFDGNGDQVSASFSNGDTVPVDDYIVFQVDNTVNNDYIADGGSKNGAVFYMSGGSWTLYAGSNQSDGSEDTNAHIARIEWRSGNEVMHLDGTDVIDAGTGSPDVSGVSIGGSAGDDNHADVNIGTWRRYDPNDGNYDPSQTYQAIADKWGISI